MTADPRPSNCRFRLRDRGKPFPRSGCDACGASILNGLGMACSKVPVPNDQDWDKPFDPLTAVVQPDDAQPDVGSYTSLRKKLADLLNEHSAENGSDTPDFILAQFLADSLQAFDRAVFDRTMWYAPKDTKPGSQATGDISMVASGTGKSHAWDTTRRGMASDVDV